MNGWTVVMEDEYDNTEKILSEDFYINGVDILFTSGFRLLKYLDIFGDTTFNKPMMDDLILDLTELKSHRPESALLIDKIIQFAEECKKEPHTLLKFYGD